MSGTIYEAIPAILADIDAIGKNRKNQQQGFNFRGIDDVMNTLHPLLAKHKVFPTCEFSEVTRTERETAKGGTLFAVTMKGKYTLHACDGSSVSTEAIGEAMDSGDKATNKAMSACYKYAMFQLLCIPTEAVDPDEETHADIKPAAKQAPAESRADLAKRHAAEDGYIADCLNEIASVESLEQLQSIGSVLPGKSQRVRDAVRETYATKAKELKQAQAA